MVRAVSLFLLDCGTFRQCLLVVTLVEKTQPHTEISFPTVSQQDMAIQDVFAVATQQAVRMRRTIYFKRASQLF